MLIDLESRRKEFESKKMTPVVARLADVEGYCPNPRYTSKHQRNADQKKQARMNVNLTETTEDPRYAVEGPSLNYVKSPVPNSLS